MIFCFAKYQSSFHYPVDRVVKVQLAALGGNLAKGQPNFYYPVDRAQNRIIEYMFYYVYLLQSVVNNSLYVGYTADLKKRFREHNSGKNVSTKRYLPWKIIHYEAYLNKKDAIRREAYLKTSQGSRLLKRMLKEYFYSQKIKII
jgi:putative endonuclease